MEAVFFCERPHNPMLAAKASQYTSQFGFKPLTRNTSGDTQGAV